jgi:hypothetical protein
MGAKICRKRARDSSEFAIQGIYIAISAPLWQPAKTLTTQLPQEAGWKESGAEPITKGTFPRAGPALVNDANADGRDRFQVVRQIKDAAQISGFSRDVT